MQDAFATLRHESLEHYGFYPLEPYEKDTFLYHVILSRKNKEISEVFDEIGRAYICPAKSR